MKYIDAEKLKAEIERQIEEEKNNLTEETNLYYGTRQQVRSTILRIIDSLQQEQQEVELEKAARYVYESWMGGTMDDVRRDMVELGNVLDARKEENK